MPVTSEPETPVDDDIWTHEATGPLTSRTPVAEISEAPPVERSLASQWRRRDRLIGFGIVVAGFVAVVISLRLNHAGLHASEFAGNWQLDSAKNLEANPFTSTWYRHVQPPLYNLYVGSMLRWSPFPPIGTIYVLSLATLLGASLLLCDLLQRWRVHPWAAGIIVAVAASSPSLLFTIRVSSYEVPVMAMLVGAFWVFQRYLDAPSSRRLIVLASLLTMASLTRSLLHPVWVIGFLLVAVAVRRVPKSAVILSLAIPVVLIGGWMLKNQVLFGTATTSSWLGFNMQRGVTAPMARADVERSVADGDVTSLALVPPWMSLDKYDDWTTGCEPSRRHPSLYDEPWATTPGAPSFNHECYLPLYAESQENAIALVWAHPGRYLSTRLQITPLSFGIIAVGSDTPTRSLAGVVSPSRTWMDAAGDATLLPMAVELDMSDWNLPFVGLTSLTYRMSWTLVLCTAFLLARGVLAATRLVRRSRHDGPRSRDGDEVLWLLVAGTAVVVILVGNLIEIGENARFRATLDPLLLALPLGALYRLVAARVGARRQPIT